MMMQEMDLNCHCDINEMERPEQTHFEESHTIISITILQSRLLFMDMFIGSVVSSKSNKGICIISSTYYIKLQ